MFVPKIPKENTILRSYLYNENAITFENQYIILTMSTSTILSAANYWKCPNYNDNRQILSAFDWENERKALLAYDKNLKINTKARLCRTSHMFGTSYLIWLEFTGPDLIMHKLDCYINGKSRDGKNTFATKVIDGIECEDIYNDIINKNMISPTVARKLNSIGSITWNGTAESKTQYKLNSFIQQKLFEKVAADCQFVELRQLDCFDDYLYRGDPGCLADYDLTIILKDGTRLTTRVDLKLLNDLSTIEDQKKKAHDAELLIATALLAPSISGCWVKPPVHSVHIEDTEEFQKFMLLFKKALESIPPRYIKIYNIDTNTGSVTYDFFN